MNAFRAVYEAGGGLLMVAHGRLLYLAEPMHPLGQRLHAAAREERPLRALASVVTGSNFESAPFLFAEQRTDEGFNGMVFGPIEVTIDTAGEVQVLSGVDADPWAQLSAGAGATLSVGTVSSTMLWLAVGAAPAGSFRWPAVLEGGSSRGLEPARREEAPPRSDPAPPEPSRAQAAATAPGAPASAPATPVVVPARPSPAPVPVEVAPVDLGVISNGPAAPTATAVAVLDAPPITAPEPGPDPEPVVLEPDAVPVAADAVPVAADAVPVAADAVPVAADAVPVAADAVPVAADAVLDSVELFPDTDVFSAVPVAPEPTDEVVDPGTDAVDSPQDPAPAQAAGQRTARSLVCFECSKPNPPEARSCRCCGVPIGDGNGELRVVAVPEVGLLRFSGGRVEALDSDLVIGRHPGKNEARQRAVTHAEDDRTVSRRHIEVRLDGWDVVVVNLRKEGGTSVESVRGGFEELPAGTPRKLVPGDTVRFGGSWFRYEQSERAPWPGGAG
jgi:ribosomal protein L40E